MKRWLDALKFAVCAIFLTYLIAFVFLFFYELFTDRLDWLTYEFVSFISWWWWITDITGPSLLWGLACLTILSPFFIAVLILTFLRKSIALEKGHIGRVKSGLLTVASLLPYYLVGTPFSETEWDVYLVAAFWFPAIVVSGFIAGFLLHSFWGERRSREHQRHPRAKSEPLKKH